MSGIKDKKPLLSICIPTWNRAKYLDISLKSFVEQVKKIDSSEFELYISDNCSDDNTPEIVKKYIDEGLPITYNCNESNLGASGNFVKCMQWASGKYILLLGDDDILKEGSLKYTLDLLRGRDYGLIHFNQCIAEEAAPIVFDNLEVFYKKVSYWFTFMSGSIFRKEIVTLIDAEKYIGTHLLQMPYYLLSSTKGTHNLLVNKPLLEAGLDSSSNGGYNFYEVFVRNYLNIWNELVDNNTISQQCYDYLKKDIYENFIVGFNYTLLIRHKNVKSEDVSYIGNRKGFKIAGAKEILKQYYGNEKYYKTSWRKYVKFYAKSVISKIVSCVK